MTMGYVVCDWGQSNPVYFGDVTEETVTPTMDIDSSSTSGMQEAGHGTAPMVVDLVVYKVSGDTEFIYEIKAHCTFTASATPPSGAVVIP